MGKLNKKFLLYFVVLVLLFLVLFPITFKFLERVFALGNAEQTWNFSNPGEYVLSDGSAIEVAANAGRLKFRNYTDDDNTVALYHFDEGTGETAADGSGNENYADINDGAWTARLGNNALLADGVKTFVEAPDSASLSLSQANTIEAWTKFDRAFSAGSHFQRQGVVDKGQYQFYYDNETGRIVYELEDSSAVNWTQEAGNDIKGSWDLNGNPTIESHAVIGTDLYVGLGNATGDAEVWKWDGSTWVQIGGDGLNECWQINTFEGIYAMSVHQNTLYVGLGNGAGDAEVWKWTGSRWVKVGGDGMSYSWAVNAFEYVYSLTTLGDYLYAGLGASANDAEVWRVNLTEDPLVWQKVGGDSSNSGWTTNFETVYSMTNDGTYIYAGLGASVNDAEVWRINPEVLPLAWEKIGGDGENLSWNTEFEYVFSLKNFGGKLYAGLGSGASDAEVWEWGGTSWRRIGGDGDNGGWSTGYEGVYSLGSDSTYLYAGLGASAGDNELWRIDPSVEPLAWEKVGGDALNGSFTNAHTAVSQIISLGDVLYTGLNTTSATVSGQVWKLDGGVWELIGGDYINRSWGFRGLRSVEVLYTAGDYLYAGTGLSTAGNAMVWEFDGSTWRLIGGQGLNNGWAFNTYETVMSMISYKGILYVGLGISAGDAEVWAWDGSSWTKIGGDSENGGWATTYEEVSSLAAYGDYLYAGLGSSASDGEVWRINPSSQPLTWSKYGGDSEGGGWAAGFERVISLAIYQGEIYAGLGSTAGDAELWKRNLESGNWVRVGGDGLDGSWVNSTYEQVDSLSVYKGKLYIGLGTGADDAEVWSWDGALWERIGGDDVNTSWTAGTYERIRGLVAYNGYLYAALGSGSGDGEVWKYDGSTWTQVAGDGINDSFSSVVEEVGSFSVYKGKLYAGTGNTANADAMVWSYGNNAYLRSNTTSQDTQWHHISATYNGNIMSIYIDGVLDNSLTVSRMMPDNSQSLLIGAAYAGREYGKPQGFFEGALDEVRISNVARTEFITAPFTDTSQTITNAAAVFKEDIGSYYSFSATEIPNGGSISYRLSHDNGLSWKYWNGSGWVVSENLSQSNSSADINSNIASFPVTMDGIKWQAVLTGNGSGQTSVTGITILANSDTEDPTAPTSLTILSASGGEIPLTLEVYPDPDPDNDVWQPYPTPYFAWDGASDSGGANVAGYWVYFGEDATAIPSSAGHFQTESYYVPNGLSSGTTYYLRVQTKDNAQNTSPVYAPIIYRLDNTAPVNPSLVSVSPAGYSGTNEFTFFWPPSGSGAAHDCLTGSCSEVAGFQYKTGVAEGPYSGWSETITDTSVTLTDAAYQENANIFYLRTIDKAGNVSPTSVQINYYYAGDAPTAPRNLKATPSTTPESPSEVNMFAFSWEPPETFSGSASNLSYCYTVNPLPSEETCTFTSPGATSLAADAFANKPGTNTFYIAAKDEVGNINYGAYARVDFNVDTPAPGMPLNLEIADVSVKSTNSWKLALSWESPETGDISTYKILRSTNGSDFSEVATTTGIAFVDTRLDQVTYYYKVKACDNTNNCGASTSDVSLLPTGRFTEPPSLVTGPTVSGITTKTATINWGTDRTCDSRVQYGVKSGDFYDEEPSNSNQVTNHTISLSNLSPGTRYFYKVKWTDEDGNIGMSDEKNFTTNPAPVVSDPKVKSVGILNAAIQYTVENASQVKIYYGKSSAFGGAVELSTSTSETTYVTTLEELEEGTKYYYQVNAFDSEGNEYNGNILTFETLPKPKIASVRVQQVKGTAQPSVLITWETNTEVSSIVSYYPANTPANSLDEVNVEMIKGTHRTLIKNLLPETNYVLVVSGRDKSGNEASSDPQRFTTATDTRPPLVSDLTVEAGIVNGASDDLNSAQLVVSWNTDESATSQVEYGEGAGTTYSQKTQEDASLTVNHLVVISNLSPSKVYHLRAISKDSAGNVTSSVDTVTITPKATDSALDLVISNLSEVFGFIRGK